MESLAASGGTDRARSHVNERAQTVFHDRALLSAFAIFLALNILFAFRLNINWDEYFFLSHIYAASDDRLLGSFQTFHVHLLGWVPRIPLSEPDQIVAGRSFMALCEIVSVACVYRIAREFAGSREAALASFAYLASGYVLAHGISFRADPLAGMLMMAALAVLFSGPSTRRASVLSGILVALGLLVTIKSVFFLPAFAGAFFWHWGKSGGFRATFSHFAVAGLAAAIAGSALFLLHVGSLATAAADSPAVSSAVGSAADSAGSALDKVILSQSLFPRWDFIREWMLLSILPLVLVAVGAHVALRNIRRREVLRGAVLLSLLLPLATLAFYRNAFPYYFPFIFLPSAVLAAVGATRLTQPVRNAFLVAMMLILLGQTPKLWTGDQSAQRSVARTAHLAFPEPVPYIDRNGMLPSFPKANQFMSTWGVEGMLATGAPAVLPIIEQRQPPLLITNSPVLSAALEHSTEYVGYRLHPADEEALRSSYIQHWGPIWVAGKNLDGASGSFALSIPGPYTLECTGSRTIDGLSRRCGSTVSLNRGAHEWSGGSAILRWGEHLPRPSGPPPEKPIYYGF